MKIPAILARCGIASALLLAAIRTSAAEALPDFFFPFPPRPDVDETAPSLLRPNDNPPPPQRRAARARKPPFALSEGDRILFLGDQLLDGELEHGYLETRLTSQYPNTPLIFRNLSWLTQNPLAKPELSASPDAPEAWLQPLLDHVNTIRPTVVFLGFGTDAAAAGEAGLEPGVYELVVDGEQVVSGTESDWRRYRIISRGPSWDQAERLRQAVVHKNAVLRGRWLAEDHRLPSHPAEDPQVESLEARIASLRQPLPRNYELRPVTAAQLPAQRATSFTPRRPLTPSRPDSPPAP